MDKQRREEIQAKRAKLAELKRQRELRAKDAGKGGMGSPSDQLIAPTPGRDSRKDIESLISSLVGESRAMSTTGASSPGGTGRSRPTSVLSIGEMSGEGSDYASLAPGQTAAPSQPQTLTTVALQTVYECPPSPVKEVVTYSTAAQTTEEWIPPPSRGRAFSDLPEDEEIPGVTSTPTKRMSRRERDREEELRLKIRGEIEEELKEAQEHLSGGPPRGRLRGND